MERRNCIEKEKWPEAAFLPVVFVVVERPVPASSFSPKDTLSLPARVSKKHHSRWFITFQVTYRHRGLLSSAQDSFFLCRRHAWFIVVVLLYNIHTLCTSPWELHICEIPAVWHIQPLDFEETMSKACSKPKGVCFSGKDLWFDLRESWWKGTQQPPVMNFWLWFYTSILLHLHLLSKNWIC